MTLELAIAWFFTFFPITISPGPANVLLSSSASQYGSQRTLPLMWGIVTVFAVQIAVVALGVGELLLRQPALATGFKYLGAAYMFYLAYKFWRSKGMTGASETKLGFREGAIVQFFNFKALTVPLIMYTQFLDPSTSSRTAYIVLTVALLVLIVSSLLAWVWGGSLLQRFFQSDFGVKWQGKIFAALLTAVGIWMLLR